ncbi:bifunctional folylpolyglutamate synthase/dihydrofolate synthase [Sediminibacillus albus]|uniref:tetrahydrofolate synthase n=1 Tax=Sediminibacillus albus TaxID=407036 RepID=A0A1G9BNS4_9BACI|nr:folylpolyglutamate synthase/dihydrofolate synthase family protein [Sediminibacillus albus]SDK41142.1 dihydrofolate synthase / folylpolyglutamate synthase [Sediminibacillus albus]
MFKQVEEVSDFLADRRNIGIRPGLERVYFLLNSLGRPEKQLKAIHVAGTNGKGSTIAYIENMLVQSGWTVGTFTSPSILGLQGEIRIGNKPIDSKKIVDTMNLIFPYISTLDEQHNPPSEFEIKVVAAIYILAQETQISIIETGMGGTEDATNCIDPLVAIITSIGRDHQRFLGDTIAQIASHKAGIIKQGIPVILGRVPGEAEEIILAEAASCRSSVFRYGHDFAVNNKAVSEIKEDFEFVAGNLSLPCAITMKGNHQVDNAALALMAVEYLKEKFPFTWKQALKGLLHTTIAGRFEKVYEQPTVILDAAHNPEGIESFLETVKQYYPNQVKHLVFAAFKDKELTDMLPPLLGTFDRVYMTTFSHERAARLDQLKGMAMPGSAEIVSDWHSLVKSELKEPEGKVVFVTGSLHFIELVRKFFVNRG